MLYLNSNKHAGPTTRGCFASGACLHILRIENNSKTNNTDTRNAWLGKTLQGYDMYI